MFNREIGSSLNGDKSDGRAKLMECELLQRSHFVPRPVRRGRRHVFPHHPAPVHYSQARLWAPTTLHESAVRFKELCLINYCTGEEEEGLEGLVQGYEPFLTILLASVETI